MDVSVIIPTYNAAKFIRKALQSIDDQTNPTAEVICVDDASTDDTVEIISNEFPNVRLYRNEVNKGPSFSRNLGVQNANYPLIAFLDADDYWESDKTAIQLAQMKADISLDIVCGQGKYFQIDKSGAEVDYDAIKGVHFNAYMGTFLIKRTVFDTIGFFDETMRLSEDQDWFFRVREANIPFKIMEQKMLNLRIHEHNTTRGLTFRKSGFMKAIKQSLDRRRTNEQTADLGKITGRKS